MMRRQLVMIYSLRGFNENVYVRKTRDRFGDIIGTKIANLYRTIRGKKVNRGEIRGLFPILKRLINFNLEYVCNNYTAFMQERCSVKNANYNKY
jgi:hypothetical protein